MFEIAIFLALQIAKLWNFQFCDPQQMQDWDELYRIVMSNAILMQVLFETQFTRHYKLTI
jgi:hypothetical protein